METQNQKSSNSARATRFLRSHGVRVGFMGVKRASLDQLKSGVGPTAEERPGNGTVIFRTWCLEVAFAVAIIMGTAIFGHVWAAKANMTTANLRNTATHVVVATVVRVYERQETIKDWNYTRYLAELRIKDIEKGEGLKKDDLLYARYWRKKWVGTGHPPPGDNGHRGLPKEGDTLRIYLARNAYDGYTNENRDGGFNVIGANGFEKLNQTGKR